MPLAGTPNNLFQGLLQLLGSGQGDAPVQGAAAMMPQPQLPPMGGVLDGPPDYDYSPHVMLRNLFSSNPAQAEPSVAQAPTPPIQSLPPMGGAMDAATGPNDMGVADVLQKMLAPPAAAPPTPSPPAQRPMQGPPMPAPAPATEILPWKIPNPEQKSAMGTNPAPDTGFADALRAALMGAGGGRGRSIGGAFASGLSGGAKAIDAIEKGRAAEARQSKLDKERAEDRQYRRGRDTARDALTREKMAREDSLAKLRMRIEEAKLKAAEQKLENGEGLTMNETLRLAELDKDLAESVRKRLELDPDADVGSEITKERERIFQTYPRLRQFLQNSGGDAQSGAPAAPAPVAGRTAYDKSGKKVVERDGGWFYEDGTPYTY